MRALLRAGGIESAEREAEWLIEALTGMDRTTVALVEGPLDEEIGDRAIELVRRRIAGEPLQYLTGVTGFRRLNLAVGPGVLIPRPETEMVAQRAMELLPPGGTVVDVGTGSGAIAFAMADERSDARVIATESSVEAMSWAAKNRALLDLDVELVLCDLMSALPAEMRGGIDVVVANPPYVPYSDRGSLPRDVVDHEPHAALFAEEDGLAILSRLSHEARQWLMRGGHLVLEIGLGQDVMVAGLLDGLGYADVMVSEDLAGKARVVSGRYAG